MGYDYLLFDADNTLFDFDAAERQAHQLLCRTFGLDFSEDGYQLYRRCNAQLWQDLEQGKCTREFLLVERFRRYLAATGERADPEALNRLHLEALGEFSDLLPGAEDLCRRLAAAGKALYLVTNAVASVQRRRFDRSPIAPLFRDVFISEELGCGKPSREFFDLIFARVPAMTRENALVIGDSLTSDIRGANNAGLPCCWYDPQGRPAPEDLRVDYVVRSLAEIPAIAGV